MKYPALHYHDYLKLDSLLGSQSRRSEEFHYPVHDEMLFITVHQTYELWFKQMLFELDAVITTFSLPIIPDQTMGQAVARLERMRDIQRFINGQIDILETMTPLDFLEFRDFLYPASGFQSLQWRLIETKLGLKEEQRLNYAHCSFTKALKQDQVSEIHLAQNQNSLFALIEKWLERNPFLQDVDFDFWKAYRDAATQMIENERVVISNNPRLSESEKLRNFQILEGTENTFQSLFDQTKFAELKKNNIFRLSQQALFGALFIQLYRSLPILQMPFRLLQSLIDLDAAMTSWRYRHALMAHRMLGQKIGTGGSSGSEYLRAATEQHKIFSDFFNLATFLLPRSSVPPLPAHLTQKMSFPVE